MNKAYFAGGCFWCIAPVFREMEGVASVVSGYCCRFRSFGLLRRG